MLDIFIFIFFLNILECLTNIKDKKFIISLTSDQENISNTNKIINSIIEQNIDKDLYDIILILFENDYSSIDKLPKDIQKFEKLKQINILFTKEKLTDLSRTLITMNKFQNNPIIIINI